MEDIDSSRASASAATGSSVAIGNLPTSSSPTSGINPDGSSSKKLKCRSTVWDHFTKINEKDTHAVCNYCKKKIGCDPKLGTNSMRNHFLRCKENQTNKPDSKKQRTLHLMKSIGEGGTSLRVWKFDQETSRKALSRMIIMDELPFRIVEHQGFHEFCSTVQPMFVIPSRWTVARHCYEIYIEEKKKLRDYFRHFTQRISLTTNIWTSAQNLSYICLTAHFIDVEWKLHKKILNFCPISSHSGDSIGKAIEKCLMDWGLERVFAVTVDNASANDIGVQYLKERFNSWGKSILKSDHLHVRCCAHILNLTVREGLKDIEDSIFRIRSAVKFVRSSPARMQKFKQCIEEEKIEDKSLVCLDVDTRWNSTYLMLSSAIKFQKAFDRLKDNESKYVAELRNAKNKGLPTDDDWSHARSLLPFLKVFYDVTMRISETSYTTSNLYFEQIYQVYGEIKDACESSDSNLSMMAFRMKMKYDKYWGDFDNINMILYIAVILDPRYKLQYVEWILEDSYDTVKFQVLRAKVRATLYALFDYYTSINASSNEMIDTSIIPSSEGSGGSSSVTTMAGDVPSDRFGKYRKRLMGDQNSEKTELDKYLAKDPEPNTSSFDILCWWKVNSSRFRILAMMARDVLAVPLSTVTSESAFSTGGQVLDSFRSSLSSKVVQALICAQNWLKSSLLPVVNEEHFEESEKFDQELCSGPSCESFIAVDPTLMYED